MLVTQWGEPEGFDAVYRRQVGARLRGARVLRPEDPVARRHVGTFPFASSMGILPFAVAFPVAGMEQVHDSFGFYTREGSDYVNCMDPSIRLPLDTIPDIEGIVRPARQSRHRPARSSWGQDPITGVDHLEGIFQVGEAGISPGSNPLGIPNGLANTDEVTFVSGLGDMRLLFGDVQPRLSKAVRYNNRRVEEVLSELFGDRVDVRCGAYAEAPGLMDREDHVAADMVRDGHRRMVIARETTDSNTYANDFMSRNFVLDALDREGLAEGVEVRQVRQVGRTPEYNAALVAILEGHLERLETEGNIAVIYTTYGLPFPGRDLGGPFSTPHPWAQEVYHENACNNFVSFKRAAEHALGSRFRFSFNRPASRTGDGRLENYFAYGLSQPADFDGMAATERFRTLRETIDLARADGHDRIVILLSHWVDDNRDTLVAVRTLQGIPLSRSEEVAAGRRWVDWEEDGGRVSLTYAEAFDAHAEWFAVGYAQRIRGGVEMFGVLPPGVDAVARGMVTRAGGGTVRVEAGSLEGAAVSVPAPPDPSEPWSFTPGNFRALLDPAENMLGAWDDTEVYIATGEPPSLDGLVAVSMPTLIGPYRMILNRPATVTLTLIPGIDADGVRPLIFNDATRSWEEVLPVPGGRPPRLDAEGRSVSFDVQVFGWFRLARKA